MSKLFKSIFKAAAPLALSYFAPGLGTAIGGALGAGASFAPIVGGAALGAGTSALTGNNALKGAALGGFGGALKSAVSGGIDNTMLGRGVNDLYQGSGLQDAVQGISSGVDNAYAGSDLSKLIGSSQDSVTLPGIGKTGLDNGTGLRGFASSVSNTLGLNGSPVSSGGVASGNTVPASAAGGGASTVSEGGMFSDILNKKNLFPALGAANSFYGNMQAQNALKKATNQANEALSPYTGIGSAAASKLQSYLGVGGTPANSADILASSPGYKFMLEQGNQGLDRAQAARGGFFSGPALKAAQDYGTGLADQTANNYYSQLANTAGMGANAANAYGNNVTSLGTARGASDIETANMINQLLSGYGTNPYAMFGVR